jgi:hypothetical protein
MLNTHFWSRPTQQKYDQRGATSDISFRSGAQHFRWRRPSFTTTIEFRCCNRLRGVDRPSIVSGDLENVCLALGIIHLSFTVLGLILLPVYGGYYLFQVFQYVARHCSYFHCDRRPRKCTVSIWNFLLSLAVPDLLLIPVGGYI